MSNLFPFKNDGLMKKDDQARGEAMLGQLFDSAFQLDAIAEHKGKLSFASSADKMTFRIGGGEIELDGASFAVTVDFSGNGDGHDGGNGDDETPVIDVVATVTEEDDDDC